MAETQESASLELDNTTEKQTTFQGNPIQFIQVSWGKFKRIRGQHYRRKNMCMNH